MRTTNLFICMIAGVFWMANADYLDLEAFGIQNCANKCNKVFDRLQYAISDQPGSNTFEFRSCIIGCNQCESTLQAENPDQANGGNSCFRFCKRFDYAGSGIRKGLIEPDKACIMGCVINTCQEICTGGTVDHSVTPDNRDQWWGLGGNGCSIKGGNGYVQNPAYGNPDSPGGIGADIGQKKCCANAFNFCNYNGDKTSQNFANVHLVAKRSCTSFLPPGQANNDTAICALYNRAQLCGTQGMG